jgi:hypothetical protein
LVQAPGSVWRFETLGVWNVLSELEFTFVWIAEMWSTWMEDDDSYGSAWDTQDDGL